MRKSERIRQLELQMVAMEYELKYIKEVINILLETSGVKMSDLDSGKWYNSKSDK